MEYLELTESVQRGEECPLKVYAILTEIEKSLKESIKTVKELALEEASKYPEKTFISGDHQFTLKEGSRRFDFKHIEEWKSAKEMLTGIEQKYKSAYQSSLNNVMNVTDSGEVLELPKVTYTAPAIICKFNKNI